MDIEARFENAKKITAEHGQEHLLKFWSELDDDQKAGLLDQIEKQDWDNIDNWIKEYVTSEEAAKLPEDFTPAPYYPAQARDDIQQGKYEKARSLGVELITAGKVAAFTVAGGQGTRLGFDAPKGDFPITPIKEKTLLRVFAETIAAAQKKYTTIIPWYVMTSPLNDRQTREIFSSNDYFGLDRDDVMIFQQGTMPNFSFEGKVLMAEKDRIAESPDGHGGSLKALFKSEAVDDMRARGVEQISYFQVDNPLIKIMDPLFIGLHAMDKAEMSSKALEKASPKEKVGNFCLVDGKVTVIEYSDLPDELAQKKNDDGSLTFRLGSIAIHIISVEFVEKLNEKGFALPFHRAVKKIPHIDSEGNKIEPEEPNGVKLETFVFDALPLAEKSIILETLRDEEFAPVKNASGNDSPEVTRKMLSERAAKWLEAAGVEVPRKVDGLCECVIEMSPSFAIDAEDVEKRKSRVPELRAGDEIYLD